MLRELISRFSRSMSERSAPHRRPHKAPIRVYFDPDTDGETARELARAAYIAGETVDLSRTGVAFDVPSIRIKEKYLVGQDRDLNIEIELPTGKVCMRARGRRYEKVGIHLSTERFFVGVHITDMSDQDRECYELFVKKGMRGAKPPPANLGLEID